MFKFFRKIFLMVMIIILFFAWIKFKDDENTVDTKSVTQYGTNLLKSIGGILKEQGEDIFTASDENDAVDSGKVNSYKLESLTNGTSQSDTKAEAQQFGGTEDAIITLINKERFDTGLDSLDKSKRLMKSALAKAEDMKRDQYFEHISRQKIQPWFFVEEVDYQYEEFGENIALDYLSANSVHKAFMDSSGHKTNILDSNFKDVGIAIIPIETKGGTKYIVVEHFGEQLEDIKPEKREKYSDKSKHYCKIQENKKVK